MAAFFRVWSGITLLLPVASKVQQQQQHLADAKRAEWRGCQLVCASRVKGHLRCCSSELSKLRRVQSL
jgi:hypothetical protein